MSKKYFNGPMLIARYEAKSLFQNGYDFFTKNEKLKEWWEDFKHFNRLDDLFYTMAENNSINGRSILGLEKLGKQVAVIQHYYLATAEISTDCVGQPRLVKLDIPVNFDNKNYKIERYYTEDETFSKLYNTDEGKEIRISGETYKLSDDIVIQKSYKHNLGFVPIVISYNLPFTMSQYQPQNILIRLNSETDTSYSHMLFKLFFQNDTAHAQAIEEEINHMYEVLHDESIKSQGLIAISGGNGSEILSDMAQTMDEPHLQAYKKSGFVLAFNGRDITTTVKQNNNSLQEIYGVIELLIEDYFNKCGLSFPSIGGGNNKHSTEIRILMLQTIETHNMKRRALEKAIKEIIYKSALLYGFKEEEIEFLFKINEPSWESELERVQALQIAYQNGFLDHTKAIMKYNSLTREKAEQLKETIDEEKSEMEEQMVSQEKNKANKGASVNQGA